MPGINGAIYQIGNWTNLKPEVPGILKEYAKAAIRTDPRDLLQWQVERDTHTSVDCRPVPFIRKSFSSTPPHSKLYIVITNVSSETQIKALRSLVP